MFVLDELLGFCGWIKVERDTLSELVCDIVGALLYACDDD